MFLLWNTASQILETLRDVNAFDFFLDNQHRHESVFEKQCIKESREIIIDRTL
jgi:hypothetical protein